MMSNKRVPPPTHYQGGPAAAADAAFWLLRNRRRGSVVHAPPLGGAGRVALLWCGVCRRCAPPLFQMFPVGRKRPPSHRSPRPPAQYAPGARGVGSMPSAPCVPNGGVGNAPGRGPGQFPTAPPQGTAPRVPRPTGGCGGGLWAITRGYRRPSGRRFSVPSVDLRRACCRYRPGSGRHSVLCAICGCHVW